MRLSVGSTRSAKPIEIETEPSMVLLPEDATLDDCFDALCVVTYLRVRERNGWCLVIDKPRIFYKMLQRMGQEAIFRDALASARHLEPDRTFADDMRRGRALVLPAFRA